MRRRRLIGAFVIWISASAGGELRQLPPQGQAQQLQRDLEVDALKRAEEMGARAKATTVGAFGTAANLFLWRVDEAIRLWKKEKGAGASPLLAEGVLFDCLGRLPGVRTRTLSFEMPMEFFADLVALRPGRAAKAFEAALKIDPELVEARFRLARIRAQKDPRAASDLERLAGDANNSVMPYLAAMSRAETAQVQGDRTGAEQWYTRALALNPRSTAASIALSALRSSAVLPFGDLDVPDPYYTYPCIILTPEVSSALAERAARVVLKAPK